MTTPEFQHPDTRLRLEATKDYFDTMIRGASLLLVAHGAALAGCIAFFKEPHASHFWRLGAVRLSFWHWFHICCERLRYDGCAADECRKCPLR